MLAVLDRWPLLAKSLWPLRSILEAAICNLPELEGLAGAAGKNPKRAPPSSETITSLREQVARALRIPPADAESHHAASSLRPASGSRLVLPWALQGPSRLGAIYQATTRHLPAHPSVNWSRQPWRSSEATFGMCRAQFSAVEHRPKKHCKLRAIQRHSAH